MNPSPEEKTTPKGSEKPLYRDSDKRRLLAEAGDSVTFRDPFRRDYARVIHCPSFRRLQGKTQLFPGHESDFFRNRLTHSLEVAQVAESIAHQINGTHTYFKKQSINPRLCFTAALVHDIGHPPFGHNGEHALDDKMREYGGFEGNAQTLRIISRLEKKRLMPADDPRFDGDARMGLNLTCRTLAAALKYDREIEHVRTPEDKLTKGYYADDGCRVERIKTAVEPAWREREESFKTIECTIMDIADDIAYSTYDLEDSLKAGFLTPAGILASSSDETLLDRVAEKVAKATNDESFTSTDVLSIFWDMFSGLAITDADEEGPEDDLYRIISAFDRSRKIASDGFLRTDFTAQLVGEFIDGIEVELDSEYPSLSRAYLRPDVKKRVETLKNYTYEATIFSTRLKVAEFRGYEVVAGIFDALADPKGYLLMPDDTRKLFKEVESNATARMRVISDFISGMTDRYALEFYGRLHSDSPQSIFKPI